MFQTTNHYHIVACSHKISNRFQNSVPKEVTQVYANVTLGWFTIQYSNYYPSTGVQMAPLNKASNQPFGGVSMDHFLGLIFLSDRYTVANLKPPNTVTVVTYNWLMFNLYIYIYKFKYSPMTILVLSTTIQQFKNRTRPIQFDDVTS